MVQGRKVAITSTLAVFEASIPGRPPLEDRVLVSLAPDVRQEYLDARQETAQAGTIGGIKAFFAKSTERPFSDAAPCPGAPDTALRQPAV